MTNGTSFGDCCAKRGCTKPSAARTTQHMGEHARRQNLTSGRAKIQYVHGLPTCGYLHFQIAQPPQRERHYVRSATLGLHWFQELAAVKFGGEVAVLGEHLAHVPRSMSVLVNLDKLPNLAIEKFRHFFSWSANTQYLAGNEALEESPVRANPQ